jgi:peptidyl-prolyl cis-trans isomerase C
MRIAQGKRFYILVVMMALFVMQACNTEETKYPEGTVAAVNGAVITEKDLDMELSVMSQQLGDIDELDDEQLSKIKEDLLENLVSRKVLYQESQRKGIEIDEAAVGERLANMKKQFPEEDDFKKMLEKMNLNEEILKSKLREGMSIQALIDREVISVLTISDTDAKKYYDENADLFKQGEKIEARHILVKVEEGADESVKAEALEKMKKIRKELTSGEDFAGLAEKYSDCPSGARGGDLGSFGRGQMVKSFEDAVFSMKEGEISDIVETQFGYHLIKAGKRTPEVITGYEDIKDKLMQYLKQMKTEEEVKKYIEKRKEQAEIERFLPEVTQQDAAE